MDFGRIIGRAWQITWKFKILWLFGFLAALYFNSPSSSSYRYDTLPPKLAGQVEQFIFGPFFAPVIAGVLVTFFLIGIVFAILKVIGRTGLVDQINAAEQGIRPTGRAGWAAFQRYGWRMFWISFFSGLPGFLIFMVAIVPLLWATVSFLPELRSFSFYNFNPDPTGFLLGLAWFFPVCCLGVFVCAFFSLLRTLGERVCVIEDQGIWESIKGGWLMLWGQLGSVFLMWLLIFVINFAVIGLIVIPAILISLLFFVPLLLSTQILNGDFSIIGLTSLICLGGVIWIWGMSIASIAETFYSCCWTLIYRQLTGREFGGDLAECC